MGTIVKPRGAAAMRALGLALVACALAAPAVAQRYPEKPIRFVVPFAPGGGTDILARALAPKLAEGLGQPVLVENRPGAGGSIGSDAVAKAAPDGYTILLGANTLAINAALYPKLPFDAARDLAPVGMLATAPMVLVVHPSLAARSVGELVALAKASPGKLNFSTPGSGTPQHFAAELFNRMAGVDITHILYKGGGPALADLVGGQTNVAVLTMASVKPHVDAGKLRALGVATAQRSASMPALPTIAEGGVRGYDAELWYAVFAPAGTPRESIARVNAELARALAAPEVRERLAPQGFEAQTSTPERLGEVLRADLAKYAKLVRDASIKPE